MIYIQTEAVQRGVRGRALASTPQGGCRGHIPSNILVGGCYSFWIKKNFIFSTSEFTKICHFEITKQKNFLPRHFPDGEGNTPSPDPTPFGGSVGRVCGGGSAPPQKSFVL